MWTVNSIKNIVSTDNVIIDMFIFHLWFFMTSPAGKKLDVKKSSWKKLSKFLQDMQKEGLLNVKELSKGSDSVIKINRDHQE